MNIRQKKNVKQEIKKEKIKKTEGRDFRKGLLLLSCPWVRSCHGLWAMEHKTQHILWCPTDTGFLLSSIWSAHMATGKCERQGKGKKSFKLSNEAKKSKSLLWNESCWKEVDFKELRDSIRSSGCCLTFWGLGVMHRMKKAWLLQNRRKNFWSSSSLCWPGKTLHSSGCSNQPSAGTAPKQYLSPSQLGCEVLQGLLEFGHQCGDLRLEPFASGPQLPLLTIGSFSLLENVRHQLQKQRNDQSPLNYMERTISSTWNWGSFSLAPGSTRNPAASSGSLCILYIKCTNCRQRPLDQFPSVLQ